MTTINNLSTTRTTVNIVETNDIIFANVVSTLYFNQNQINDAGIFQTMLVAGGDEGGLIGIEHKLATFIDYISHAADDDPVLATMMMHLQGKRSLGFDHDALNLEALALLQDGIGSPRTRHCAVYKMGIMTTFLELANNMLDILGAVLMSN